ncbi:unnamed protein product [Amoebophrya sp. A25]|nr:unnamed protein product [Amoebophrya sp. A25]CAD7977126.1 unnamed protein product [Amoebophrya sp. A25]|eukprot:GSA25T00010732001.1
MTRQLSAGTLDMDSSSRTRDTTTRRSTSGGPGAGAGAVLRDSSPPSQPRPTSNSRDTTKNTTILDGGKGKTSSSKGKNINLGESPTPPVTSTANKSGHHGDTRYIISGQYDLTGDQQVSRDGGSIRPTPMKEDARVDRRTDRDLVTSVRDILNAPLVPRQTAQAASANAQMNDRRDEQEQSPRSWKGPLGKKKGGKPMNYTRDTRDIRSVKGETVVYGDDHMQPEPGNNTQEREWSNRAGVVMKGKGKAPQSLESRETRDIRSLQQRSTFEPERPVNVMPITSSNKGKGKKN